MDTGVLSSFLDFLGPSAPMCGYTGVSSLTERGVFVARHRVNQSLLHHGVDNGEHSKLDGQSAEGGRREDWRSRQPPAQEFDIAAPIASAPPPGCRVHPFGRAVTSATR